MLLWNYSADATFCIPIHSTKGLIEVFKEYKTDLSFRSIRVNKFATYLKSNSVEQLRVHLSLNVSVAWTSSYSFINLVKPIRIHESIFCLLYRFDGATTEDVTWTTRKGWYHGARPGKQIIDIFYSSSAFVLCVPIYTFNEILV